MTALVAKESPGWLDQVIAAPAVGILYQPWLGFPSGVWEWLDGMHGSWRKRDLSAEVNIVNPTTMQVSLSNGVSFDLDPKNVVGKHGYRMKVSQEPGEWPTLTVPDAIRPFSELTDEVIDELAGFLRKGPGARGREVVRIGIMAQALLIRDKLPPGIESFVAQLKPAWTASMHSCSVRIVANLEGAPEGQLARCNHTLAIGEKDAPNDVRLILDWQRLWEKPFDSTSDVLMAEVQKCAAIASRYFESVGSGMWEDET